MRKFGLPLIVVAVVAVMIGIFALSTKGGLSPQMNEVGVRSSSDGLPGLLTGLAPWPNNTAQLSNRLDAIGLPKLSAEGSVLHIHQHLDIFIDGQPLVVPALIGIAADSSFISPIHVHDTSGVIHVESPAQQVFFLGQFFDVWGVKLSAQCIGEYCTSGDKQLSVYVNGQKLATDPRKLKLESHQEIVVAYGTPAGLPNPIPSSYAFSNGE